MYLLKLEGGYFNGSLKEKTNKLWIEKTSLLTALNLSKKTMGFSNVLKLGTTLTLK